MKKVVKIILVIFVIFLIFIGGLYYYQKQVSETEIANLKQELNSSFKEYSSPLELGTLWSYDRFIENLLDENKLANTNITITVNGELLESYYEFLEAGDVSVTITLTKTYKTKILKKVSQNLEVTKTLKLAVVA